jgi:hypothetical protein
MPIQLALVLACQEHVAPTVTVTVPVVSAAEGVALVGEIEGLHVPVPPLTGGRNCDGVRAVLEIRSSSSSPANWFTLRPFSVQPVLVGRLGLASVTLLCCTPLA